VSWKITFSRWGLPLTVKASGTAVSQSVVTWVKDAGIPHCAAASQAAAAAASSPPKACFCEARVRLVYAVTAPVEDLCATRRS
jgi:hypothetical protein